MFCNPAQQLKAKISGKPLNNQTFIMIIHFPFSHFSHPLFFINFLINTLTLTLVILTFFSFYPFSHPLSFYSFFIHFSSIHFSADQPTNTSHTFLSQETTKITSAQIPFRSTSYAPSLRHVALEYSDKVNDDHLSQIVCVCRGTLYIRDYYGQPVEPKWVFL